MSKESLIKILEGTLDFLRRVILFLPSLIGLIDPAKLKRKPKAKAKTEEKK